jgi:hypothetical protein
LDVFESAESVPSDAVVCSNDKEIQRYSLQGENKLQIPQHTLEQYHVYANKCFTKIHDWAEPKQKKQRPNNVDAQRTDPPPAERSEKEELMAKYVSKNAQMDSMCKQLWDLNESMSVMKKHLEELGAGSEIAKPMREPMVYTLPHKRSGAIEVDVDRGVVFTSDLANGVVMPELQLAARVEMPEETTYVLDPKRNIWVDKRSVIVDKCNDTKTRNMADVAKKFRDLFKGKHCSFPDRTKYIIAASPFLLLAHRRHYGNQSQTRSLPGLSRHRQFPELGVWTYCRTFGQSHP